MIKVTKLNGEQVWVNPDQMKTIEKKGDTILTLMTGERWLIKEGVQEINEAFIDYKRTIHHGPLIVKEQETEN